MTISQTFRNFVIYKNKNSWLMKCNTFIIAFLLLSAFGYSQGKEKISAPLFNRMQIPNDPEKIITVLIKGDIGIIKEITKNVGGTFRFAEGDIASINIKLKYVEKFSNNKGIKAVELPHTHVQPLNDKMILADRTNAIAVEDGSCLGTAYNGDSVVIGIIDTGIDINQDDFKTMYGDSTRIRFIWDQRQSGNPPLDLSLNYGHEWYDYEINGGFCGHTDTYNNSHGTIVSGIAAGNGNCNGNRHGVAPNADIIVVALDFANPNFTISDATKYIYARAAQLHKPCVINASVGDYFGSHDGQDLESQLIGNLISDTVGRSFVCAVGNIGGSCNHFGYDVTAADTNFTWLSYVHCTNCDTFMYVELWGDTAIFNHGKLSIGVDSVDLATNYFAYENTISYRLLDSINNTIYETLMSATGFPIAKIQYNNGTQNTTTKFLQIAITPMDHTVTDAHHFFRITTTGITHIDGWSFDTQHDNIPTTITYPAMVHFKAPDDFECMAAGFNCSDKVITVGAYANRNYYTTNCLDSATMQDSVHHLPNIHPGEFYNVSSHGPTRDGRIKPEVTSPGLWVLSSAVLSEITHATCENNGAGGCDVIASGTSMASPSVAGIAALYLQYKPNASWSEIKNCIMNNCRVDSWVTGLIPNNYWGYGKADACLALQCIHTDVVEHHSDNSYLNNYPNPFMDQTTISYNLPESFMNAKGEITINDLLGNTIKTIPLTMNKGTIIFNKSQLQSGIYFYSIKADGRTLATKKMMVL